MFAHYSLRGVLAAFHAVKALAAKAGRAIRPIPLPAELQKKRRRGMSAKSPYGLWRGCKFRSYRLARAIGPGSYDEASPQDLIRARRIKAKS